MLISDQARDLRWVSLTRSWIIAKDVLLILGYV